MRERRNGSGNKASCDPRPYHGAERCRTGAGRQKKLMGASGVNACFSN